MGSCCSRCGDSDNINVYTRTCEACGGVGKITIMWNVRPHICRKCMGRGSIYIPRNDICC